MGGWIGLARECWIELYEIADGKAKPKKGDPTVVICIDEFGLLNLLPRPGKQWAPRIIEEEDREGAFWLCPFAWKSHLMIFRKYIDVTT
jgi:hypothetical protein